MLLKRTAQSLHTHTCRALVKMTFPFSFLLQKSKKDSARIFRRILWSLHTYTWNLAVSICSQRSNDYQSRERSDHAVYTRTVDESEPDGSWSRHRMWGHLHIWTVFEINHGLSLKSTPRVGELLKQRVHLVCTCTPTRWLSVYTHIDSCARKRQVMWISMWSLHTLYSEVSTFTRSINYGVWGIAVSPYRNNCGLFSLKTISKWLVSGRRDAG